MGPRTANISPHKYDFWIGGCDFFDKGVGIINKWLLVMVDVVSVLRKPTYPPRKVFLKEEFIMGGLIHISMRTHHKT